MKRAEAQVTDPPPPARRYPGSQPFGDTPLDRKIFRGREQEIELLKQRVLGAKLLVLFGASGVGKTSLLNAGLFQYLREKACLPVPVTLAPEAGARDCVVAALRTACSEAANTGVELTEGPLDDLWSYLQGVLVWKGEMLQTPVLVFDQFEDIFGRRDAGFRRALADQLGALVSGVAPVRDPGESTGDTTAGPRRAGHAPRLKIVLSISEEYLGALEELSPLIPGLFQDRVRLSGLSVECAKRAICEPAALVDAAANFESPAFTLDEPALRELLDFLLAGGSQVAPFQLQLLCRHAEQVAAAKAKPGRSAAGTANGLAQASAPAPDPAIPGEPGLVLGLADLGGRGAFAQVMQHFYRDATARLPWQVRRRVRRLCEEGLVSATGTRQLLEEGAILQEYKLTAEDLEPLRKGQWQLLRRGRRLESWFYEIANEALAAAIVRGRAFRLPKGLRYGLVGAGAVALVTVALLASWNAQLRTARDAEAQARAKADDLAGFLLGEEFLERLRLVGRTEMLDSVQQRVDHQLPTEEQAARLGPSSSRNLALAHRNRGQLLEARGYLREAVEQYEHARRLFEQLAARHGDVQAWQRELGRSARMLGDVRRERGEVTLAARAYEQSEAARRAVLGAGDVDSAQLELAETLVSQGFNLVGRGEPRAALSKFAESLERLGRMRGDQPGVSRLLVKVDAQSGHAQALAALGWPDADRATGAALQTARELADAAPYLPKASYNLAVAISEVFNRDDGAPRDDALQQYELIEDTLQKLVRWDPSNAKWRLDSSATTQLRAFELQRTNTSQAAAASAAMDRACEVVEGIEREHPAEARWKAAVADCLWGRGFLLSEQRKWRASADEFIRAAQRYDAASVDPEASYSRWQAIRARWFAADVLTARDPSAAAALLAEVRGPAEALLMGHPDLINLRSDLVRQLLQESGFLARSGDPAGASRLLERASAVASSVPADQREYSKLLLSGAELELQRGHDALTRHEPEKALASAKLAIEQSEAAAAARAKDVEPHRLLRRAHDLRGDAHRSRNDARGEEIERRAGLKAAQASLALAPESYISHNEVWLGHLQLARFLRESRRGDEALRELGAGIRRLEHAIRLAPEDAVLQRNARAHWTEVVAAQNQRGDFQAVEQAWRLALAASRKAVAVEPHQWAGHHDLYLAHVGLGDALLAASRGDDALEQYRQSLHPLAKALAMAPGEAVLHADLSAAWIRITERHEAAGRLEESLIARRNALKSEREAVALKPNDAAAKIQLATSYLHLARALRKHAPQEALATAQLGLQVVESALSIERRRAEALHVQALLFLEVALSMLDGDAKGAVDTLRSAIAVEVKALGMKPAVDLYAVTLYRLHEFLVHALISLGTEDARREALVQVRAGIAAAERAARIDAANAAIGQDLARLRMLEEEVAGMLK